MVSGRLRARARFVKEDAKSPRPCSRRRMFGDGFCEEDGADWGWVMVMVRWEGKSEGVGGLVGISPSLLGCGCWYRAVYSN